MKTLSDFYALFPSCPATPAPAPVVRESAGLAPVALVVRPDRYRERTAGNGYGRSSGYAASRSYTAGRDQRLLRIG